MVNESDEEEESSLLGREIRQASANRHSLFAPLVGTVHAGE